MTDKNTLHKLLSEHIEELQDILNLDPFNDLESKMDFLTYLSNCEDWFKNNDPVEIHCCSLCGGAGKFTEYDYTWTCPSCWGTGNSFNKE